jgi:MFS family permease
MITSAPPSIALRSESPRPARGWRPTLLIGLLIAALFLPWLASPAAGLTFGVIDLAEWASLHPTVRENDLLLPGVLRCVPLFAAWVIAFSHGAHRRFSGWWWIGAAICLLLVVLLLPPLEILTSARSDGNYRQQAVISGLALIVSAVGLLWGGDRRWAAVGLTTGAVGGLVSSLMGVVQAYSLMRGFYLPVSLGFGAIISLVMFALFAITSLTAWRNKKGVRPAP